MKVSRTRICILVLKTFILLLETFILLLESFILLLESFIPVLETFKSMIVIPLIYRLCEERNQNLRTKFDFYTLLNFYFYLIRSFVSAVYKLSVPSYHRLLVIEAADGIWIPHPQPPF